MHDITNSHDNMVPITPFNQVEDSELIKMVLERSPINPKKSIPAEEIKKKYGITEDDLEGWEDIELE